MDQHLALAVETLQHVQHPAGAALWEVPHFAAQALADFADTHLVVAPQGAVQQQAIGTLHPAQHFIVDSAKARRIEQRGTAAQVFDEQANGVARLRVAAIG
ncbi:hypothetical protein D9M71_762660 [compost metagenome]